MIDPDVASLELIEDGLPEGTEEDVELHHDGIDEEGVGECGVGMGLDECHEEAEADQHHHVGVLPGTVSLVEEGVGSDAGRTIDHAHKDGEEDEDQQLQDQ